MKNSVGNNIVRHGVGLRIRQLREQRGLSQHQFAKMIGMDRSYLINIEKGKRNVSIDMLTRIAVGLGVWVADLFPPAPESGLVLGDEPRAQLPSSIEFQAVD